MTKSGGMFKKWFSSPAKPVIPGGNTYGEPRSTAPKMPPSSKMKSQEDLRQSSIASAISKESRDSSQKRPQTARDLSTNYTTKSSPLRPNHDESVRRAPSASVQQSYRSPDVELSRHSNQYERSVSRQAPDRQDSYRGSTRTNTMQSQNDGEDGMSDGAQPQVYGELEELKARIRHLELTRRSSGLRTSHVESIPEGPSTSGTITSTSRPRIIPNSSMGEMRSPSYFGKSQSLLQSALGKAEQRVSRDVFNALEAAAQDAMDLAAMSSAANTSTYSSSYTADSSMVDKRLRRTADNLCRSLTELCIALCEDGSDMRSESRASMRRRSEESLYQSSQAGTYQGSQAGGYQGSQAGGYHGSQAGGYQTLRVGGYQGSETGRSSVAGYSSGQHRRGSVTGSRDTQKTTEPAHDDGQSLASRQAAAAYRRTGSVSTITRERYNDNDFRFDNDESSSSSRTPRLPTSTNTSSTSGGQQYGRGQAMRLSANDDTPRSRINPKYSNMSLREQRITEEAIHALTSDHAEMRSPVGDRAALRASQTEYLQPGTHYGGNSNHNSSSTAIYELPTHISPNDRSTGESSQGSSAISSPGVRDERAFPFPTSPTSSSGRKASSGGIAGTTSSPIQITGRSSMVPPGSPSAGAASGTYSSTLTQRIMERRMQQQQQKQGMGGSGSVTGGDGSSNTFASSVASLGSSLPAQNPHSLLNGLPSAGAGAARGAGNNRSAPRVGLLKPAGFRHGSTGFGGGVTG